MKRTRSVLIAAVVCWVPVGCGSVAPGASSVDAGSDGDTSVSGGDSSPGKCSDLDCDPYGDDSEKNRCMTTRAPPLTDACGTVHFLETNAAGGEPPVYGKNGNDTEKDAACALAALRDAVPGTRVRIDLGNVMGRTFLTLEVSAQRRVDGYKSVTYDSPLSLTGLRGRTLKPASYFADCLTNSDLNTRAYCLKDALLACK